MNDKQFLQRMRKMVNDTHWVQSSLTQILEYIKNGESLTCLAVEEDWDPAASYKVGKMGYCIMGMVGFIGGMGLKSPDGHISFQDFEIQLHNYPQASRITEILWDHLPSSFQTRATHPFYTANSIIREKAGDIESWNDYSATSRDIVLSLLDECIADYKPKRAKK